MEPFVDYLNRNIGIIKRQYSRLLEALKKDGSIQNFWKDHSFEYKLEDFQLLISQLVTQAIK